MERENDASLPKGKLKTILVSAVLNYNLIKVSLGIASVYGESQAIQLWNLIAIHPRLQ